MRCLLLRYTFEMALSEVAVDNALVYASPSEDAAFPFRCDVPGRWLRTCSFHLLSDVSCAVLGVVYSVNER